MLKKYSYFAVLLVVAALSSCSKTTEVGDIYRQDGIEGIVLHVDTLGVPTHLLSIEEAVDLDQDSAIVWAASLNGTSGNHQWVLPDSEQMQLLASHKSELNASLSQRGESSVLANGTWYWTSSRCENSFCPTSPVTHGWAYGPDGLRTYFKENHSPRYRARAVMVLE